VLIAATDGVSDSFDGTDGEEFLKFIRSLVARIKEYGIENVAGSMSEWLDRYSNLASGDDMTLAFVCINGVVALPANNPDLQLLESPEPAKQAAPEPHESWGF
jgi:hypothetical protein